MSEEKKEVWKGKEKMRNINKITLWVAVFSKEWADEVKRIVSGLPGVEEVDVNLAQGKVTVYFYGYMHEEDVIQEIRAIGITAVPWQYMLKGASTSNANDEK